MIEVKNISKLFNDRKVLNNISVEFDTGKMNLIIGQSGSGKTVLMKCIVGLLQPDAGEIIFDDIVFTNLSAKEKRMVRQSIGMLFQGSALFDSITVEENIMFPLDMFTEMKIDEKRERANFCLKRVNIENANKLFPSELSGGMQKRVAIARAIALQPKYLLCDEPNSGLDPKTSIVIDDLIKEITIEFNMTTIVNTHDMNSVMGIGDKVVFIFEGEKCWEGNNKEILQSDNPYLNDFVFASRIRRQLKARMQ
jgi:phospholipid/cholesterol/gamma-HCH transport system ATP-binding protein